MEKEAKGISGTKLAEILKEYGSLTYTGEIKGYFIYNLERGTKGYTLSLKPVHNLNSIRENELQNALIESVRIKKEIFVPNEYVWKKVANSVAKKFNANYNVSESFFWNECKNEEEVKKAIERLGLIEISLESKIQKEIERLLH